MTWVCMSVWLRQVCMSVCGYYRSAMYMTWVCMSVWLRQRQKYGTYMSWVCMSVWLFGVICMSSLVKYICRECVCLCDVPYFCLSLTHTHIYMSRVCMSVWLRERRCLSYSLKTKKCMWREWVCLCERECISSWKIWHECVSFSVWHVDIFVRESVFLRGTCDVNVYLSLCDM